MKTFGLLFFIFMSSAIAAPCGKDGPVAERIKDCNQGKESFVLVARDDKGVEIYQDIKTGLVWGDRIGADFNHYGSSKACSSGIPEAALFKNLRWRLPTVREFETAASHGMKAALPNMNHVFWTSTPVRHRRWKGRRSRLAEAYLWDGIEQRTDRGDLKDAASVRCVAKP